MTDSLKVVAPNGVLALSSDGTSNVTYNEVTLATNTQRVDIPANTGTMVMLTEQPSVSVDAHIQFDSDDTKTLIDKFGGSIIGPGTQRVFHIVGLERGPDTGSGADGNTYPRLRLTAGGNQTVHVWFYA